MLKNGLTPHSQNAQQILQRGIKLNLDSHDAAHGAGCLSPLGKFGSEKNNPTKCCQSIETVLSP